MAKPTSKSNPCPICGNISGYCKHGDGDLILCHNHEYSKGLTVGDFSAIKQAAEWCVFAFSDSIPKAPQPQQKRQWIYYDPTNNPAIRVNRTDDGTGKKQIWQEYHCNGVWATKASEVPAAIKKQAQAAVMPYRYHEAIQAAVKGYRIYWVEGEKCADRLWELGIAATTTIGGSEGYNRYGNYSQAFAGVDLVICPDRDLSGIKYANAIATDYPKAQWLYAFPDSEEWENLPKSGGLDIFDWIASGADRAEIEAAVGDRQLKQPASTAWQGFSKVVSIHTGAPIVSIDSLDIEIKKLLDRNLTGAKLQAEKIKLRQSSALTDREFAQLWEVVERDYEVGSESNPDEIRRLLRAKRSSLALADVVPGAIAAPLGRLAQMMNLREEVYLVSLLTTIGSLAQNGTTLLLHKGLGFEVAPNLYSAVVAVASQRKSPVISQIATKPLKILEKEARQAHKRALEAWQERKAEAKNNDEPFNEPEPSPEIYFFTKASGEAILQQANRCRNRGLLNLSDELAGVFKSKNQYRGGRGSDGEDMLSYYDAAGGKTLRVDGVRNDVDSLNYGILGGIQPRVLADFLGNCEDSNGNWARFIFVNQPIAAATWPEGDFDNWDITTMLADYYRAIAWYDPVQYRLSKEAEARFGQLYNELEQRRVSESNPALQAVIGKSAGRIGKVALGLHLLESAAAGMAVPSSEISVATIEKAAMVAELAIEQIRAIYSDCDTDNQQNPVMAKIVELSQRKGEVAARDVYQSLPSKSDRPNTAKIRQLFAELADQGFGEVVGEGKSIQFNAYQEQIKPVEVAEPEPIEPEIQPGDCVVLASDSYQGLEPGQQMLIVRLEESDGRLFALAMDHKGTNHSIWLCHLQKTYKPTIEQEAS